MRSLIAIWVVVFSCAASSFAAGPLRVALVLDKGGKDDKSFNAAAYKGALEAKQKLGVFLKTVEASDDSFFEPAMRTFIQKKFDLIIGVGMVQAETIEKLAQEFPKQKFLSIDAPVKAPNVVTAIFQENEGSYLVGYVAGLKTKTGKVGFLGGMDIPLIRRFEKGYVQGVKASKPGAEVFVNYVGVTNDAWNNPTKAKELAQNQYSRGADIIFAPAGASNAGVFDAAETSGKFAIGVDSNQNWIKPGRILTSMLKRVDVAVYEVIDDARQGRFDAGIRVFGLKNQGVDWAIDSYNEKLFTGDDLKKIENLKKDVVAGKTRVVDYYEKK
jgi:basic membrane protein A